MAREQWFIDGWEVTQGYFRDVEKREGLLRAFAPIGQNTQVSNRPGRLWQPKDLDEARFTLNIWITGVTLQRQDVEAAWDDVLRVINHPERTLAVERHTAAGEVRTCDAEVTGEMSPTFIGQAAMRAALEFNIPDGFWRSATEYVENNGNAAVANNTVVSLTSLAPSTAPMSEAQYEILGPVGNPRLEIPGLEAREWMLYTGNVPAGATLKVNARDWSVTGTGFTANPAALTHGGHGPYLTIPVAHPGQSPQIRFKGANTTGATRLTVRSRRAYLA